MRREPNAGASSGASSAGEDVGLDVRGGWVQARRTRSAPRGAFSGPQSASRTWNLLPRDDVGQREQAVEGRDGVDAAHDRRRELGLAIGELRLFSCCCRNFFSS